MAAGAQAEARRFGKYTLVARLAIGGMAEIFLARFQGVAGFEKLVCIKRILPQFARDPQFVSMFLAEARIAAQISHPNVCQVFELGELDGRYFIAMEYLEGVPLAGFRRRDLYGPTPEPRLVAGLAVQAAEGLHHAHQLKKADGSFLEVVHRDVSGNNLFATVDGVVKVLDFGIAKVQDASIKTSTGSVKGTYAYMAPEQLRGERIDRRTDVFALGIVVWELLARRHLFKRETDFLTFQAITTDPIADVCEVRPDVPPELGAAIAKALARVPNDRYNTARELGQAITRSVGSIGGVLDASGISEEIERGFAQRMKEQRALIGIARAGGELDLDEDPIVAIGHGTEMLTTPHSIVSGLQPVITQQPAAIGVPAAMHAAAPPVTQPTGTEQVRRRSNLPWAVAAGAIVLAAGAVIAMFAMKGGGAAGPRASGLGPPDATTRIAATADAAPIAVATVTVDAARVAAAVVPDAPPAPTRPQHPTKKVAPPPVAVPSGPPGFITIDSAPVYATIFVDGRKLGDTPIVHISLPPGRHAVRAVSASGGTQSVTILIESGKTAPARRIEW